MIAKKLLLMIFCGLASVVNADDYTVTTTDDSGDGSFRDGLEQLLDNDIITFDDSLSGTIQLLSSLPAISANNISIVGPISEGISIDGSSLYQIFEVSGFASISNLNLINNDPSTAGSAVLVDTNGTLFLDAVSLEHCNTSCQAPINVLDSGTLITNNVTFSSPSNSGVDVLFQDGSAAIFANDSSLQPQVWIETNGTSDIYKEGDGTLELKAGSTVDMFLIADEGTLLFSDTTLEPIYALPNGIFAGTPTANTITNIGIVETGDSFGTISLDADYVQDNGGTMVVKVDPTGSTDLIQATANGLITGDVIIQLQPGTYTSGKTYEFLNCPNGINGTFENAYLDFPVEGQQPLSNSVINYNTTSVVYEVTHTFTVNSPTTLSAAKGRHHKPHHKKKMGPSPVSHMFSWIKKHKRRPHENLLHLLRNYPKQVQCEVLEDFHKKHKHH